MAFIDDWSSLESQINKYLETPDGKKKSQEVVDKIMLGEFSMKTNGATDKTPRQAADMFIKVLEDTIKSAGLSSGVEDAISKGIVRSIPYKNGKGYSINIYWEEDLSRPSLLNGVRGGSVNQDRLVDLAELYDTGVDHTMNQVWGIWHGKKVGSKTKIEGAYFMEEAKRLFMDGYATEYGVEDITIRRGY